MRFNQIKAWYWAIKSREESIERVIKTRDKEVGASQPTRQVPWLLALSSPVMHERGLEGNDSFNWILCTAFNSYKITAFMEMVTNIYSGVFILFLTNGWPTHYVWLRGRTLVDCIMVDRGADWHRAHLSRIPNDSSHEYHPPRKKHLFQIGIVELKLYRESWTFGEISLFVMFSGGFCEAYQLSRVQTTKV